MAVGFPADKAAIDYKVGTLAVRLRDTLAEIERTDAWLAEKSIAELTAIGYTQADVDTLRAALGALAKYARIRDGRDTAPTVDDFFYYARKLMGLN